MDILHASHSGYRKKKKNRQGVIERLEYQIANF